MTRWRSHALGLIVAFLSLAVAAPVAGQSAPATPAEHPRDPSFLLGTWHVTETLFPGTEREYVETSVRTCERALRDTYVLCKTLASARGRQRETWFLVNQHDGDGSIEMLGVLTNIPGKTLYRGRFLDDGSGIDLRSFELGEESLTPGTHQRLRFTSADEFVWTLGIRDPGTPEESVIGIERAVRVSPGAPPP